MNEVRLDRIEEISSNPAVNPPISCPIFPPHAAGLWLLVKDAASLMGIHPRSVRKAVHAGRLTGRLAGGPPARGGAGGRVLEVALASLPVEAQARYWRLQGEGQPAFRGPTDSAWASAPEAQRRTAQERLRAVEAWRAFLRGARKERILRTAEFSRLWNADTPSLKLSPRTLSRWDRMLREGAGSPSALLPAWGGRREQTRVPEGARRIFLGLYLTPNRPAVSYCIRRTRELWEEQGRKRPLPGDAAFRALADRLPQAAKTLHREGAHAFDASCAPYITRDYTSILPNDWWVMDHRQCDAAARGPDGRPLFPWVTAVMDVRSRRLLGWYLHTGPNQDTVLAALRRALLHYGVPRHLLVDNGKDFRARALTGGRKNPPRDEGRVRALTGNLGIACHFAAPYNPKAKPIERAFRTLKEWLERRFAAYRGGSPQERPEGLRHLWKRVEALPSLPQLDQIYGEFIEGVYNEHSHTGDGMENRTPREVYDALLPRRATVAPEALHLLLMRQTEPRLVRRNGVWVNDHGLWYRSADLLKHQGERVYLRYDLSEVGRVFAFDEEDRFLCEATARPALAWGAKQEDVRAALSEMRAFKRQAKSYRKLREEIVQEPHALKRAVERRKGLEEGETLPAIKVRRRKRGPLERAAKEVSKLPTPTQRSQREDRAARERERLAGLLPGPAGDPGIERDRAFEALFERLARGETP